MTRATVLQEVRQMRFEEVYARQARRELLMVEAGACRLVHQGVDGLPASGL